LRTGELLDLFGGRKSIKEKRIRLVSDRALTSDPLRLLRAIRFALELGFEIEPEVFDQARLLSLAGTAAERIGYELLRIVNCDRSFPYIARLYELGLLHQILPEAKPLLDYKDVMQHSLGTYQKLEEMIHGASYFTRYEPEFKTYFGQDPQSAGLLKLVGLLHDIGKPETEFTNEKDEVHFYGHDALGGRYIRTIGLERLRLSRDRARAMKILVDQHMRLHLLATGPELTDRAIRRFLRNLGPHWFGLMMVTFADGFATAGHTLHLEEMFQRIIALKREYDAKIKVKRLVTGDDLIASGMTPGPAFKKILAELEELQVEGKIVSKEQGLEYVQTNLERLVAEGVEK
jgi:tRNA nucleotidyltransferase/poly(A) polymerase